MSETKFDQMLRAATDEAVKNWQGEQEYEGYRVLVFRMFRNGWDYYSQRWSKDGQRITKDEARAALARARGES